MLGWGNRNMMLLNFSLGFRPRTSLWPCCSYPRSITTRSDVEDVYERKTPHEHVLLRPGMYIGQVELSTAETWTLAVDHNNMEKRCLVYSPALVKLFDEIVVNASDNKHRDTKMSEISVTIECNADKLEISVRNDGKGIPVAIQPSENIYIPELIFGHLLTGSNFVEKDDKLTGGRHGYGAKLTNIFSTWFDVETYDSKNKLLYKQTWENNMMTVNPPVIEKNNALKDYTKVSFRPELSRFGLPSRCDAKVKEAVMKDVSFMLRRRMYDIAACVAPAVKVVVNGETLPVNSFLDYVNLFKADEMDLVFHQRVNNRWEVAVKLSSTGSFENMSFVNSVWTARGGTHVNHVTSQVVKAIEAEVKKKGVHVSAAAIKNQLMVFVKSDIANPSFDSQSKDTLTTKPSDFGSECVLPQKFLKEIIRNSGIVEDLVLSVSRKDLAQLTKAAAGGAKKSQQVIGVPKLQDAHDAGTARALECSLILTEGDSAKALAVAGLEAVGRQKYGVLPLRGKILNVRVATIAQATKNQELISLCKTLGLDFNNSYEHGVKGQGLRYGKVMIMCDQDDDGSHIKGLIINFFHHFWPNLLKIDGFLQQFVTPLVKLLPKKKSTPVVSFFSMQQYNQWLLANDAVSKDYKVKYYKGLGTSTAEEGKEYFQNLPRHKKDFVSSGAGDGEAIDMAFNSTRAEDRRNWLSTKFNRSEFIDPSVSQVTFRDFVDKEMIHYSNADNERSIPCVVDGLKPSQRKVLHACFKRKLEGEIKVVQLAGYVAEQTAYHHGETSLHTTIIGMAQDYVGANNVPFLVPAGQFGTRAQGGKDFASARYIFTKLAPVTRLLFPEADDPILEYLQEDGLAVEPKYFIPVVPTLLINGSEGIGTGWSTSVPPYRLSDVAAHITQLLKGKTPSAPLTPWVRGFVGSIELQEGAIVSAGVAHRNSDNTVEISELPFGKWTDDYKEYLNEQCEKGLIQSFVEDHTNDSVRFEITAKESYLDTLEDIGVTTALKLKSKISLQNMHAFSADGAMAKFSTPEEVVQQFFPIRLQAYQRRKAYFLAQLAADEALLREKCKFVREILSGELQLLQSKGEGQAGAQAVSEKLLAKQLKERGYMTQHEMTGIAGGVTVSDVGAKKSSSYAHLFEMPIHSLTEERSIALQKSANTALAKLQQLNAQTPEELWLLDLEKIMKYCKERDL